MRRMQLMLSAVVCAAVISACGGGDKDTTQTRPPIQALEGDISTIKVCPTANAIAADSGGAWVACRDRDTVVHLDAKTGKPVGKPIEVGASPVAMAIGGGSVWSANANDGSVSRIDERTGQNLGDPIPVGRNPQAIAFVGNRLWAANERDRTLVSIDADTNRVTGRPIRIPGRPTAMEAVGNELWVLVGPNAKLLVVDPARRRAVRKPIPLPKSASSFVVDSGSVWANDLTKSEVTRIPRDGGDSVTAPVLAIPVRIAKGGDTIWTANQQSGAVTRLDATTLKLKDRPVPAGGQPSDVEVVDNTTWVSNFMDGTVTRIQAR